MMSKETQLGTVAHIERAHKADLHHIRFVEFAEADQSVLLAFSDPAVRQAIDTESDVQLPLPAPASYDSDEVCVLMFSSELNNDPKWKSALRDWIEEPTDSSGTQPVVIHLRDTQILWRPGRALVCAPPSRWQAALLALVDFGFYEGELRKLERETSGSWSSLESDISLAYDATASDLSRHSSDAVARRMAQTLQWRIRHARTEPHLFNPMPHLPRLSQELSEELREAANVEDRLEVIDGQIEVYEQVYELSSQRMSDLRIARRELTVEFLIVALLVVDVVLWSAEILWILE